MSRKRETERKNLRKTEKEADREKRERRGDKQSNKRKTDVQGAGLVGIEVDRRAGSRT